MSGNFSNMYQLHKRLVHNGKTRCHTEKYPVKPHRYQTNLTWIFLDRKIITLVRLSHILRYHGKQYCDKGVIEHY